MLGKVLLLLLTFFSCTCAGSLAADRLQKRKKLLDCLCNEIRTLSGQIVFLKKPLAQLLTDQESPLGMLFQKIKQGQGTPDEIWKSAYTHTAAEIPELRLLKDAECAALETFLLSLGRTDASSQRDNADFALSVLVEAAMRAGEESSRSGRIYRAIGVLCGAAFAVFLL